MLKKILLTTLLTFFSLLPCKAVLYNYKELLANETEPLVGVSAPLVSVKLKALVTYPDPQFDSRHTKLNNYFSLKSDSNTVIAPMRKTGEAWDIVPDSSNGEDSGRELTMRFALCRDLFSQLAGWRCQYVDLYQTGHFRMNPFPPDSDKVPGAAAIAARELREFRNVLLRQGLFDREIINLGFTFHYITNEALGDIDPRRLIEVWRHWTEGRVSQSGGGAGQIYGSINYNVNCFSNYSDLQRADGLIDAIKVPRGAAVELGELLTPAGKFNPYTHFTSPLTNDQIAAVLHKARGTALTSRLEVLDITPSEDISMGIGRGILQELTREHGVFVKFNLIPDKRHDFWKRVLQGNDNYYNYKVILSLPEEKLDLPEASPAFHEMNERFHWVYGV